MGLARPRCYIARMNGMPVPEVTAAPSRRAALARSLLPIPLALALAAALLLLDCAGPGLLAAPEEGSAASSDLQPQTTLRIHYPAGGRRLTLRGDAARLSWSQGAALADAGGDTWVFTTRALRGELSFKPLLDDATWSRGFVRRRHLAGRGGARQGRRRRVDPRGDRGRYRQYLEPHLGLYRLL